VLKIVAIVILLCSWLFGDFFVMQHGKKISFTSLQKIPFDYAVLKELAQIDTKQFQGTLLIQSDTPVSLNEMHPRLIQLDTTRHAIALKPHRETPLSFSLKLPQKSGEDITLELFYQQKWYVVLLQKPLFLLHQHFEHIKMKNLSDEELQEVLSHLDAARKLYPLDDKLKTLQMELNNKKADRFNKTSNHMQQGIIF